MELLFDTFGSDKIWQKRGEQTLASVRPGQGDTWTDTECKNNKIIGQTRTNAASQRRNEGKILKWLPAKFLETTLKTLDALGVNVPSKFLKLTKPHLVHWYAKFVVTIRAQNQDYWTHCWNVKNAKPNPIAKQ